MAWRRSGPRSSGPPSTSSGGPTAGSSRARTSPRRSRGGEESAMSQPLRFSGIMPANLLPFTADLAIDEVAYRRHLRWLVDTPGVTGIVANGHASEVSSLSREERKRALAIAVDEVAGACPVVAGVYADGTREAVELARDARAAGAAGGPGFPPTPFLLGAPPQPHQGLPPLFPIAARARPSV